MNATLSAPPGRHDHPPQPTPAPRSTPESSGRRVGLIDRLALHLGVALVTWSNRPRRSPRRANWSRESLALYREQQLARAELEREAERRLLFTVSHWRA